MYDLAIILNRLILLKLFGFFTHKRNRCPPYSHCTWKQHIPKFWIWLYFISFSFLPVLYLTCHFYFQINLADLKEHSRVFVVCKWIRSIDRFQSRHSDLTCKEKQEWNLYHDDSEDNVYTWKKVLGFRFSFNLYLPLIMFSAALKTVCIFNLYVLALVLSASLYLCYSFL